MSIKSSNFHQVYNLCHTSLINVDSHACHAIGGRYIECNIDNNNDKVNFDTFIDFPLSLQCDISEFTKDTKHFKDISDQDLIYHRRTSLLESYTSTHLSYLDRLMETQKTTYEGVTFDKAVSVAFNSVDILSEFAFYMGDEEVNYTPELLSFVSRGFDTVFNAKSTSSFDFSKVIDSFDDAAEFDHGLERISSSINNIEFTADNIKTISSTVCNSIADHANYPEIKLFHANDNHFENHFRLLYSKLMVCYKSRDSTELALIVLFYDAFMKVYGSKISLDLFNDGSLQLMQKASKAIKKHHIHTYYQLLAGSFVEDVIQSKAHRASKFLESLITAFKQNLFVYHNHATVHYAFLRDLAFLNKLDSRFFHLHRQAEDRSYTYKTMFIDSIVAPNRGLGWHQFFKSFDVLANAVFFLARSGFHSEANELYDITQSFTNSMIVALKVTNPQVFYYEEQLKKNSKWERLFDEISQSSNPRSMCKKVAPYVNLPPLVKFKSDAFDPEYAELMFRFKFSSSCEVPRVHEEHPLVLQRVAGSFQKEFYDRSVLQEARDYWVQNGRSDNEFSTSKFNQFIVEKTKSSVEFIHFFTSSRIIKVLEL